MQQLNKIYNCPYKIEGEVLTIYNPFYEKQLKDIGFWKRLLFKLKGENVLWNYVTLLPGDCFQINWNHVVGQDNYLSRHEIFWNGKFLSFYKAGPTPTENLRDLRPRCRVCGDLKLEGNHADCVEEALEQYH